MHEARVFPTQAPQEIAYVGGIGVVYISSFGRFSRSDEQIAVMMNEEAEY
jgi:hypothetical protein